MDQAVSGLTQDGKIVSVRLALFVEMFKAKSWTPATLRAVGGTEGVGVAFLEETFSSAQANPKHRVHQRAAQAVLKKMLPETGSDIKGQMRSEAELRDASGYDDRPRDFADLTHILDPELRLITPTEPEGSDDDRSMTKPGDRYYQLTHDYLVHSLRGWLTRKQRETRRGRAELRLEERSASWNAKPENRHLPSVLEWVNIRLLTRKKGWTDPQRKMMKRASQVHGLRTLGLVMLVSLITWGGIEGYGTLRASSLVESLKTASTTDVPTIVRQLGGYRRWANPRLMALVQNDNDESREKLHGRLALLPVDQRQAPCLEARLLVASPIELPVIRDALKSHRGTLTPKLWSVLDAAKPGDESLLPAVSALASYDASSPRWESVSGKVAQALVTVNPVFLGSWLDALRPVRGTLNAPLAAVFRDKQHPESEHTLATNILAEYASDDPNMIADLLMDSDPKAYATFFRVSQRQVAKTFSLLQAEIAKKATIPDSEEHSEETKDRLAERQARAAVGLIRMGKSEEISPLLVHSADPRLRSFIVNWLNPLGADPQLIAAALGKIDTSIKLTPTEPPKAMDSILFHPETSIRRALILALGTYGADGLTPDEREPLTTKLLDLYRNDPDAGIHGAAEWTLRQWGHKANLQAADAELTKLKRWDDRRWCVNSQGQTYALVEGPIEFMMGSPPTQPNRFSEQETLHRIVIPRRFVIANREVTVEQYQRFVKTNSAFGLDPSYLARFSPDIDGPMISVSWYGAVAYCNWLSEQEGLPKDQWCYHPNETGVYDEGMTIPADALKRTGYRLPTEAEWEYTCRSGTITSRYYGLSVDLVSNYAWHQANSREHAWAGGKLLPNDLGLFDMLGNAFEWVQDRATENAPSDTLTTTEKIQTIVPRVFRGGSFFDRPGYIRSAYRNRYQPSSRFTIGGFRPSRSYP